MTEPKTKREAKEAADGYETNAAAYDADAREAKAEGRFHAANAYDVSARKNRIKAARLRALLLTLPE